MTIFAAVRATRLHRGGLRAAEKHARREDLVEKEGETPEAEARRIRKSKRIRPDVDPAAAPSFGWAFHQSDHLNITRAFDALVENKGAVAYGKSAQALHLVLVVSLTRVKASGDPYSEENQFVADLHNESKVWADTALGGCFATRYDVDEHGSGVVDAFCAPTREFRGKVRLMASSALRALQKREGETTSYGALQSSWARHCRQHLDLAFQRGDPKSETGHEHIVAGRLREAHEAKDKALAAEHKELLESIQDRENAARDQEASLADRITGLEEQAIRQGAILKKRAEALEAREARLRRRNAEMEARGRQEEKRREDAYALRSKT